MSILCKCVINSSDIFWSINVGNIITEAEEIVMIVCWVPVKFLPGIGRVVEWSSDFAMFFVNYAPIKNISETY